ncbi:MAG: hypothetical protein V3U03_11170, partial [Myxococcota bacterium]
VGIFSTNPAHNLTTQLIGVGAYGVATFSAAMLLLGAIKAIMGLRVSPEEEIEGLDISEHGMHAYDFDMGGAVSESPLAIASATPGVPLRPLAAGEEI